MQTSRVVGVRTLPPFGCRQPIPMDSCCVEGCGGMHLPVFDAVCNACPGLRHVRPEGEASGLDLRAFMQRYYTRRASGHLVGGMFYMGEW